MSKLKGKISYFKYSSIAPTFYGRFPLAPFLPAAHDIVHSLSVSCTMVV